MAQKILSGITLNEFIGLVEADDARGLTRIKGIGQKIAQRLVLELKDRVGDIGAARGQGRAPEARGSVVSEAVAALVGLGANPGQAKRIVEEVAARGDMTVEAIIKEALRKI